MLVEGVDIYKQEIKRNFVSKYLGPVVFIALLLAYKLLLKPTLLKPFIVL